MLFTAGCTRYSYELVNPPELRRTIEAGAPAVVMPLGPLVYELQTAEDRLVMTIRNEADGAVKLVGGDSYAVDPSGESHPLPTRTIAPRAVTKLIFPPLGPVQRPGPVVGFGVGVRAGHGAGPGADFADDFGPAGDPRYYSAAAGDPALFWEWSGTAGTIRLRLAYEGPDGKRFAHEFEFARRKA
jgi:hypothetical protein